MSTFVVSTGMGHSQTVEAERFDITVGMLVFYDAEGETVGAFSRWDAVTQQS